jgi:hypothetical protein
LRGLILSVCSLLFLVFSAKTFAAPVTLAWNTPISAANLAGYMLYYGYASGTYGVSVDVGDVTTAALSGLDGGRTYYFAATAYDIYGIESSFSNEVSYTVPVGNTTPPNVTITSPADGASVRRKSSITTSATASDEGGVIRVEFYVNGSLVCTDTTSSYNCAWRVPAASGRTYQLQAKAYDASGNVGLSSLVTVSSQ